MKPMYIFWTGILSWLMLIACQKEEINNFEGGAQVYFKGDSTTYSFAVRDTALSFDTVEIPIVVTGSRIPYEREVNIEVVPEQTTAIEGIDGDYVLCKAVIPANQFNTTLKVRVNRSKILKKEERVLVLLIASGAGMNTDVKPAWLDYKLKINDILTQPARWIYDCYPYFGAYSEVKYRFIIETLKMWDFPSTGEHAIPKAQMLFYQDKMKTELAKWEKEHKGPMIDEKGNVVKF